jgi:hypothetical protein
MNDHHQMGSRLGDSHPHKDLLHGHYDKVFGKDCREWMVEWIQWLLEAPYDDSPMIYKQASPFDNDNNSRRPSEEDKEKGVLFLAASNYGSGGSADFTNLMIVPLGEWHLFFAPYMIFNSNREYPSLSDNELFSLAQRQVDAVSDLEVKVDGLSTECCRVPLEPIDNIIIKNIPTKNVLGISREELKNDDSIKIVGDGYGCFLKPLDPGLHTIKFKGYSPFYEVDKKIQLSVRGPNKKPTV